jgi:hypothetical protein
VTWDKSNKPLLVKFMHRGSYSDAANTTWLRQFPGNEPTWGKCRFTFDPEARAYDWFVVYHDLPPQRPGQHAPTIEKLACHPENTLHVNYEPSNVTTYGHHYLQQYGHVLTSHEPSCVRHPNRIYSQSGLPWFYGRSTSGGKLLAYDDIHTLEPPTKTKQISTVCSTKQQKHTAHQLRFHFTRRLKQVIPEMEIFGRGVQPIDDKAEALNPYRFHLAIENHFAPHHWTEKLADSFLGFCLPIYAGCPNAADYFPQESFVTIDPRDFDDSLSIIRHTLENDQYKRRLPAIREARRLVLEKHNVFAVLSKTIEHLHQTGRTLTHSGSILSRPAFWKAHPIFRCHCIAEKTMRFLKGYINR